MPCNTNTTIYITLPTLPPRERLSVLQDSDSKTDMKGFLEWNFQNSSMQRRERKQVKEENGCEINTISQHFSETLQETTIEGDRNGLARMRATFSSFQWPRWSDPTGMNGGKVDKRGCRSSFYQPKKMAQCQPQTSTKIAPWSTSQRIQKNDDEMMKSDAPAEVVTMANTRHRVSRNITPESQDVDRFATLYMSYITNLEYAEV